MNNRILRAVAAPLLAICVAVPALSQEFYDRRSVQDGQPVSDNPRRVMALPAKEGFDGTLVLQGGRIFDSVAAAAYPGSLVIRQNRIVQILPAGSTDWPADAKVVDVTGRTVMPGLIDMHVHIYSGNNPGRGAPQDQRMMEGYAALRGLDNLRHSLESGITSVRDQGSLMNTSFILSGWLEKDRTPGPRVFTAGHIITAWGGHAAERTSGTVGHSAIYVREADGADDWRKAVREMFKSGATHIKIASHFAPEEVKAAVEESHRLGLKVTCDCETIYVQMAIDAGVDSIEHPLPRTDEAIRQMAKKGVAAIPTLYVYQRMFDTTGVYAGSTSRRFAMSAQKNFDMLKKMIAAGVKVGVGTDIMADYYEQLPHFYIAELKFLQKAGYSPAKALIAATRVNAEILDMGDKLGTLEPGRLADVIVVDGRPDENLDDLARVGMVIRNGNIVVANGGLVIPRYAPVPLPNPSPPDTLR